jgi:hypothetical protein
MARLRCMLTALALGSAIVSRSAVAQHGSSVSLTHVVTVTVPPRIKVQVERIASSISATKVSDSKAATDGLALSVSANRAWVLSIGSGVNARQSHTQWSLDNTSGFSGVTNRQAMIASGEWSPDPKVATLFLRNAAGSTASTGGDDGEPVLLTVTAP